jgi:hypothetical protein
MLRAIGFEIRDEESTAGITTNQMATLLVAVVSALLFVVIVFGLNFKGAGQAIKIIALITTTNLVSVAIVIYTKDRYKFSRRDEKGFRPVFYYLLVAVIAVLISVPISFGFNMLIEAVQGGDVSVAMNDQWQRFVAYSYLWKMMVFTTTFCIAFQLDNKKMFGLQYPALRWFEALLQSAVAVISAYIAVTLMNDIKMAMPGEYVYGPLNSMVLNGIVGFAVGFTVPYWYRMSPREVVQNTQTDEEYVSGSAATVV